MAEHAEAILVGEAAATASDAFVVHEVLRQGPWDEMVSSVITCARPDKPVLV